MDPLIDLPTHCIICYNFITSGQSVLLHCECVLAMCQSCAYAQIAVQHYTYLRGLTCPSCRIASYNISGIEKCQLEEKKLVQSAAKFFCRSKSKVEPSEKQLLIRAIKSGYESSMSLAELEATDGVNLGVPLEASMIRLELARLESRRLAKLHHGDGNDLGPLVYLRISRNIFLEAAIELSMKLKGTCSNNDAFSRMKEIAQTTGFDAIVNPNPNQIPVIRTSTSNIESYSEDSEQQQEKAKPKQLCVCGDEEDGFYVQCTNGTGGCNGWVHPECIPRLRGMSKESISMLQDFICPLCELKIENLKQIVQGCRVHITSGKFRGCSAIVLSKNIGTNIRVKFTEETPFSGQIISMNIKQLEAENGQSEKKMSSISAWSSSKSVDRALLNECSGFVQNVPFTSSANNSDHHISPSTHRVQTYCICGNRGSGKFVECRSEEKCKSSRFFHMSCVGFLDSSNPTKQKSFICQECDKHLFDSKAKRVHYNVDPSNILYASEIDTSSEFHHLVPTNRHRSSLYTHLFQNKRNQYFNNPPRLPYYHSSTDTAVTTASVSTTIKPQSHAPPLFLSQFTLPKSKSPSAL